MASAAKNRQGRDTRRQLVRVAERLFAEHGVDGVSIRAVNAAADLGAASIHYHFGSKDKLVEAVIDEHGAWVSARVQARAAELAARPDRRAASSWSRPSPCPIWSCSSASAFAAFAG